MLISVVIPSLDRPALLSEAIASVAAQTYTDWEVVIVDDGSTPPVDEHLVRGVLGERFRICRHETPNGIPESKNAGVRAASGEIIMHLDDDDLLVPHALERIAAAFDRHRLLDCLFLNVEPFGRLAPGSARNQDRALHTLLSRVNAHEEEGVLLFDEGLFEALLKSVPIAFQRPAARRSAWNIVGELTEGVLFSEPDWAIRASMRCSIGLMLEPLNLWRCDDQNSVSRPDKMRRARDGHLHAAELLVERLEAECATDRRRLKLAREYVADTHFSFAYQRAESNAGGPWASLLHSVVTAPRVRHLKLAARLLIKRSS